MSATRQYLEARTNHLHQLEQVLANRREDCGALNGCPWALRLTIAGVGRSANVRHRSEGRGASLSRLDHFRGSQAEGAAGRREPVVGRKIAVRAAPWAGSLTNLAICTPLRRRSVGGGGCFTF
jgi:hypothetical protein